MSETAQLQIIEDASVSINDLVRLQSEGFSVMRSAHVGNLSPYNLTIADAGIPILLVDHNVTGNLDPNRCGADRSYFPEATITQAENTIITDAGKLSCRALVKDSDGIFVDDFHITAIEESVPNANLISNTEYIRANEKIAGEVLTIAAKEMPEIFTRIVTVDGRAEKLRDAAELVSSLGIMQLLDDPRAETSGVLVPNEVDIVLNFIVEVLNTEQEKQYHLSGPDMINYVLKTKNNALPELQRLYDVIKSKASFKEKLPDTLEVRLVPSAEACFATTRNRREEMEALLLATSAEMVGRSALADARREFFTSGLAKDSKKKQEFEKEIKIRQAELTAGIEEAITDLPEHFAEPKQPSFITQYDVASEGGLFVASQNMSETMSDLALISRTILAARKRRRS